MTPAAIITELYRIGVTLGVRNGRLQFSPASQVDKVLRQQMLQSREALIQVVSLSNAATSEPQLQSDGSSPRSGPNRYVPTRFSSKLRDRWLPSSSDDGVWCAYRERHRVVWQSVHGDHLLCAICQKPPFPAVVRRMFNLDTNEDVPICTSSESRFKTRDKQR